MTSKRPLSASFVPETRPRVGGLMERQPSPWKQLLYYPLALIQTARRVDDDKESRLRQFHAQSSRNCPGAEKCHHLGPSPANQKRATHTGISLVSVDAHLTCQCCICWHLIRLTYSIHIQLSVIWLFSEFRYIINNKSSESNYHTQLCVTKTSINIWHSYHRYYLTACKLCKKQ